VALALLRLDADGMLAAQYAPYKNGNGDEASAVAAWLSGTPLPGLTGRTEMPETPTAGDYLVQHMVYLGKGGFRKAALAMLDYLLILPPGQELTVLCQGRWDWFIRNIPFVLQFIAKLRRAVQRGTRMRMINRKGYSLADSSRFAGYWLAAHMKGYIRSLYYEGEMPREIRFVGSIPGYWSARAEEDHTVEDSLYVGSYTDPRETRRDAAICDEYAAVSKPSTQYAFFDCPAGSKENERLWESGGLPLWEEEGAKEPDGSFHVICRVPGLALLTRKEAGAIAGSDGVPALPDYLFCDNEAYTAGPHRVILCREDVREGLSKERRMHEVMSALLHRRAFVQREMLAAQIRRLLKAMQEHDNFEVALMPKSAFEKLELELVCFKNSITVGWLQDGSESVFCNDEATAGSIYGYIGVVWDRLHMGWKRKRNVQAMLRKWLAGKDLDATDRDSAAVLNWDVLPKE
ncbi:MAG: hypothetical protein FWH49_08915, partial [Clostridiales bacterium]|nr:hypothetical protein [Clostridiales bacterium]